MSEDIKVSFSAIQQLATDVQNESNKIQTSLDTLDSEVKKLYGSWDGQAQQAYQTSKSKWDQKMAAWRGGQPVVMVSPRQQAGRRITGCWPIRACRWCFCRKTAGCVRRGL